MRYFRKHRGPLLSRARLPLAIVGVLVLIALVVRAVFPDAFFSVATPLFSAGNAASQAVGALIPADVAALRAEVLALQSENRALRAEREASVLTAKTERETHIHAEVVARPPLAPYDVLIVKPQEPGSVLSGAIAYADGIPVGTVADRPGTLVRITLFSAAGRSTEGWVGSSHIPVRILGRGAGAFSATVPRDAGIVAGDSFYLPGGSDVTAGTVIGVEHHASSPEAELVIRPAINPFSLEAVFISDTVLP